MREFDNLFPPYYTMMIRVGEVGGILEISLSLLADMTEEHWRLSRISERAPFIGWLATHDNPPEDARDLTKTARAFSLMLLCRSIAMLTTANVPPAAILSTVSVFLPVSQRKDAEELGKTATRDDMVKALSSVSVLPSLVHNLLSVTTNANQAASLLLQAADIYRRELVLRLC